MSNKYNILILLVTVVLLFYISYIAILQLHVPMIQKKVIQQQVAITTPTPIPTPLIDDAPADIVAAKFYSAYQNCLRLSSSPNSAETLLQFCLTNTRLTLLSFNQQAETQASDAAGIDPVFCANAPPINLGRDLKLGSISTINSTTATVPITENYDGKIVTINFIMQKNDLNQWKVAKITCK